MKNFFVLVAVVLVISAVSYQANAATFDLGAVYDSTSIGNTFKGNGPFSDTYLFVAPDNGGITASATSSFNIDLKTGKTSNKIKDFSAFLDGVKLSLSSIGTFQFLTGSLPASVLGFHALEITGSSAGSYGGSIAVAQTPIPAAMWLFGSALMGLIGATRRKKA